MKDEKSAELERDRQHLRILLVDDNADIIDSLATLFGALKDDVRVAYDGVTAIGVAQDFLPDVAFLDIDLPGLDGHEVARRLRKEPSLEDTLLVALTACSQDADRERSRQAGFDYHLTKPASFSDLQWVLDDRRRKV